jgi:hypothetical protein
MQAAHGGVLRRIHSSRLDISVFVPLDFLTFSSKYIVAAVQKDSS